MSGDINKKIPAEKRIRLIAMLEAALEETMLPTLDGLEGMARMINANIGGTAARNATPGLRGIKEQFNTTAHNHLKIVFEAKKRDGNAKWIAMQIHTRANQVGSFVAPRLIELCRTSGWREPLDIAIVLSGNTETENYRMINEALNNMERFNFYKEVPQWITKLTEIACAFQSIGAKEEALGFAESVAWLVGKESYEIHNAALFHRFQVGDKKKHSEIAADFDAVATRLCRQVFEAKMIEGNHTWVAKRILLDLGTEQSTQYVASKLIELCRGAGWEKPLEMARARCGKPYVNGNMYERNIRKLKGEIENALEKMKKPAVKDYDALSPVRQAAAGVPKAPPKKPTPDTRMRSAR